MTKKELEEKTKAQEEYCDKNSAPHFAPYDGICFRCYRQIYEAISLEDARDRLVTGCPYCHMSYCD